MDYALDMHNFHEGSHQVTLAPILVATNAPTIDIQFNSLQEDHLLSPIRCNALNLADAIRSVLEIQHDQSIDSQAWEESGYKPTPTIIEATLALYNGHSVADISRSDATAENLTHTSASVAEIVKQSKSNSEKQLSPIPGSPGATSHQRRCPAL